MNGASPSRTRNTPHWTHPKQKSDRFLEFSFHLPLGYGII